MAITMARATVAQKTQVALETTYGQVPSSQHWKRLPTLAIHPQPNVEAASYREQGRKFSSVVVPNREWSSGTFEGAVTYGELPFIFASLFALPAGYPYTPGPDGDVTYVIAPSNDTGDIPATFSLQHGDASAHGIATGGTVVTDATLDITRENARLSGTLLALPFQTEQTLAVTGTPVGATVTDVENIPVTPGSITAFMDPTFGAIGTTKLSKLLSVQLQLQGRWGPDWVLDAAQPSYLQLVELAPTATATLRMEADAQAASFLTKYRTGSVAYLRVTTGTNGPALGSTHYKMQLDLPFQVKNMLPYNDEGGVYGWGCDLEPIADAAAPFPMQLTVTNKWAEL